MYQIGNNGHVTKINSTTAEVTQLGDLLTFATNPVSQTSITVTSTKNPLYVTVTTGVWIITAIMYGTLGSTTLMNYCYISNSSSSCDEDHMPTRKYFGKQANDWNCHFHSINHDTKIIRHLRVINLSLSMTKSSMQL